MAAKALGRLLPRTPSPVGTVHLRYRPYRKERHMSHVGRRIATTAAAAAAVALPVAAAGAAYADALPLTAGLPLTSVLPVAGTMSELGSLPVGGGLTNSVTGPLTSGVTDHLGDALPLSGLPAVGGLTGSGSPLSSLPVVGGLSNAATPATSLPVVGNLLPDAAQEAPAQNLTAPAAAAMAAVPREVTDAQTALPDAQDMTMQSLGSAGHYQAKHGK
jgi:hypothetical protein